MVYEYICCTGNKSLVDNFAKIIAMHPSQTQAKAKGSRKKRDSFQTPSTCVWIHTDQNQGIRSVKQFLYQK